MRVVHGDRGRASRHNEADARLSAFGDGVRRPRTLEADNSTVNVSSIVEEAEARSAEK
jgi:hypothetical protein